MQGATENLIARDTLISRFLEEEARKYHLRSIRVDGSQSLEEMTDIVEEYFFA